MSDIKLNRVFPLTIFSYIIPNYKEINKKLLKEIYRLKNTPEDNSVFRSNIGGYHSKTNKHLNKEFEELKDIILNTINDIILNDYTYELYSKEEMFAKEFEAMWFNINKYMHYNSKHLHPNAWFSGAYYVKTPDPESNYLDIDDPIQERSYTESFTANMFRLPIKEGMLVLFPGWTTHGVPPNYSKTEDRISISFNVCKPKEDSTD